MYMKRIINRIRKADAKTTSNLSRAMSSNSFISSNCLLIPYTNRSTKPQCSSFAMLPYDLLAFFLAFSKIRIFPFYFKIRIGNFGLFDTADPR